MIALQIHLFPYTTMFFVVRESKKKVFVLVGKHKPEKGGG